MLLPIPSNYAGISEIPIGSRKFETIVIIFLKGTRNLVKRSLGEGNIRMDTAAQYRKYAEQCDEMARRMPRHAPTLQTIAQAWREVAMLAEQKEKSAKDGKDERDGSMHTFVAASVLLPKAYISNGRLPHDAL
jgi:hypothetical protein